MSVFACDGPHVFMQRFGMNVLNAEGNEHVCRDSAKNKAHCGKRRSQRTGEVGVSPCPRHGAPSHQAALPCGQDRVTSPEELQAKISLFHKILGGPKVGVGVQELLHGCADYLKTACFVLTLFFFKSLYISKRPFLHDQNWLLSTETVRKGHPLPKVSEKLSQTPPFLSELPQIDVSFKNCEQVLHSLSHPVPCALCGWLGQDSCGYLGRSVYSVIW